MIQDDPKALSEPLCARSSQLPQASGLPIAGSAFRMRRNLRSFLTQQYRRLGPIFQVRAFNRRLVALVGPEANVFVQKHGKKFLRSYETWCEFNLAMGAKDALTGMDGPSHLRMRKTQTRAFSRRFIENRLDEVVDITERVIAKWPQGPPIGAQYEMQKIIAEQIAILTTGVSAFEYLDDLITVLDSLLKVHIMRQSPAWTLRLPRQRRARQALQKLYQRVWDHHAEENRTNDDLIDDLIELHGRDPEFLPETDLPLALLGPFFAGIETAASTSAFMLYALLKHPDLLERMTAEADAFFKRGHWSPEGLRDLAVTHSIAMETLRMYPAIPALSRTAANSFEFAGYSVPARSQILIGNTVPHHLPECFPDPYRFDIDRFAPGRAEYRQPGVFAPFGLGTHRCLGSDFAEVEITLTMLTILRNVELAMDPPGYQLKIRQHPTLSPAPSFKFRVLRRRS